MDWTIWTSPKTSVCLTHDLCTYPNPVLPLHPYPLMGEPTQFYPLKGEHIFYFFAYFTMVNGKKTFNTCWRHDTWTLSQLEFYFSK